MFVATWLKEWERNSGEIMYQVLLNILYDVPNVQRRKNQT